MYFMIRDDPSDIGMAHLPSQIGLWFCLNLKKLIKVERVEGLVIETAYLRKQRTWHCEVEKSDLSSH